MIKKSFYSEIKYKENPETIDDFGLSNDRYSVVPGERIGEVYENDIENSSALEENDLVSSDDFSDGISNDEVLYDDSNAIYATNKVSDFFIKTSQIKNISVISENEKINYTWGGESEDLRYSSVINGSSEIILEKFYSNVEDYKLFIKNAEKNAGPILKISIIDNEEIIEKLSLYCNFKNLNNKILQHNKDKMLVINKNSLNKIAYVNLIGKNNTFNFICDISEEFSEQEKGLQGRDFLRENTGMIFTYASPRDLVFHMGKVKFPIDILFVDENNMIKKSYKNIKPNTLGTFGCTKALNVVEIPGGFCDKNNISEGDYVTSVRLSNMKKNEVNKIISSGLKSFSSKAKISPYDYNLIKSALAVNVSDIFDEKETIFSLNGSSIPWSSLKSLHLPNLKYSELKIKKNSSKKNMHADDVEFPFVDKFIVCGNIQDSNVNRIAVNRYFESISSKNILFEIIKTSNSHKEIGKGVSDKFGCNKVFFKNGPLYKTANFPVPESVKEMARKSDKRLLSCSKKLLSVISDLETNVAAYDKVKENQELIISSKAQFNQSMKKIIEKYTKFLETAKTSMSILHEIRDASQVEDLIKSLSQSSLLCSESLEEISNLIESIEDIQFFSLLTESTDKFKNLSKDIEFSIKGCREFIHSHILGVLVLS